MLYVFYPTRLQLGALLLGLIDMHVYFDYMRKTCQSNSTTESQSICYSPVQAHCTEVNSMVHFILVLGSMQRGHYFGSRNISVWNIVKMNLFHDLIGLLLPFDGIKALLHKGIT